MPDFLSKAAPIRARLWIALAGAVLLIGCANGDAVRDAAVNDSAGIASSRGGNVILFVGDGMGVSTVTAARIFAGQKLGLDGEEHTLSFERFPQLALVKTYNTDLQVPDSAGTMTALVTGAKTRAGVLSVAPSAPRGDCAAALEVPLATLLQQAEAAGKRTGLVSTARITHATPAATYAHSPDRDWEDDAALPEAAAKAGCIDIATQMLAVDQRSDSDGIDLMLGGGRANFLPEGALDPEYEKPVGRRKDGRHLINDWLASVKDRSYVWNRDAFLQVMQNAQPGRSQVLGLFEPSHMQWEADRTQAQEPSLAELTASAIRFLQQDNVEGYFLMVEAGRIDHAHHMGNAHRALEDTLALDAAVQAALEAVDLQDTLILVTADHSHTLTMSGYPARGNPILGKVALPDGTFIPDANGQPYTTLGYANGRGPVSPLPDVTDVDTTDKDYLQAVAVPLAIETHAGEDVAAYATGRNATALGGVMEQNLLYGVMYDALFGADPKAQELRR
ncbi:MAG: alkaline phosphatase [Pseudomonadales bacterium]